MTFITRFGTNRPTRLMGFALLAVATSAALIAQPTTALQGKQYPLKSTEGLRLHNVAAKPAALRVARIPEIVGNLYLLNGLLWVSEWWNDDRAHG